MKHANIPLMTSEVLSEALSEAYLEHVLPIAPSTETLPTTTPYDTYVLLGAEAIGELDSVDDNLRTELQRLRVARMHDARIISDLKTDNYALEAEVLRLAPLEDTNTDLRLKTTDLEASVGELIQDADKLLEQTTIDEKTDLLRYSAFKQLVEDELQEQTETIRDNGWPEYENAILMLDIDDFKEINTIVFHTGADEHVLIPAAEFLKTLIGHQGMAARFGGEEFVSFLRDMDREEVQMYVEAMQKTLNRIYIPLPDGTKRQVGFTIGISRLRTYDLLETAIENADIACLIGKQTDGKNQILHYANVNPDHHTTKVAQALAHEKLLARTSDTKPKIVRAF